MEIYEVPTMRNLRSYYSASISEFLQQSSSEIIGIIHSNDISAETTIQQSNTWKSEVQILKDQLRSFSDGRIIFEYTIPRMGKRVDAVVLYIKYRFPAGVQVRRYGIPPVYTRSGVRLCT